MTLKLTAITPVIDGYAVVIAQQPTVNGEPGTYLGCFLRTPEQPTSGSYVLLAQAMKSYLDRTGQLRMRSRGFYPSIGASGQTPKAN